MKMFKTLLIALIMLPMAALADTKVGVVNVGYVWSKNPAIAGLMESLQQEQQQFSTKLQGLEQEVVRLGQDLQRNAATLSQQQRLDKQSEIDRKRAALQAEAQDAERRLASREGEVRQQVNQKLVEAIKRVAERRGLDLIVEASAVGYVSSKVPDVTEDVLAEISR